MTSAVVIGGSAPRFSIVVPGDGSLVSGDMLSGFDITRADRVSPGDKLVGSAAARDIVCANQPTFYSGAMTVIYTEYIDHTRPFDASARDAARPAFCAHSFSSTDAIKISDSDNGTMCAEFETPQSLRRGDLIVAMPGLVPHALKMAFKIVMKDGLRMTAMLVRVSNVVTKTIAKSTARKIEAMGKGGIVVDGIMFFPSRSHGGRG